MATRSSKKPSDAATGMPDLGDITQMLKQMKVPAVDVKAFADWQRKDFEALSEANRQAYEGMRALAERRSEILRENMAEWQAQMKDSMDKDAMAKHGAAMQRSMNKAMKDFRELMALEMKARADAWKVVQQRMQENMANVKELMKGKK